MGIFVKNKFKVGDILKENTTYKPLSIQIVEVGKNWYKYRYFFEKGLPVSHFLIKDMAHDKTLYKLIGNNKVSKILYG